jgi:drug/metabolite transporter (DMT)-like permease
MTPGLGFALAAMVCFGVSDLVYKRGSAAGVEAGEFVMLQGWAFCPGVTLYAWLSGTLDLRLAALWGSLAGAFLFVALFNFAASLRGGAVSTNAPIFRLNFTLTAALAILLLGEALTLAKAAALVCALAAVWLLLAEPGGARGEVNIASLVRVLIATVAMALTNFIYKIGLQHGALPETMVSTQAWVFTSLATIFHFWRNDGFRVTPGAWRYSTLAALALAARLHHAAAWACGRAGERARARGANEFRFHRFDRRGPVSRKARLEKAQRPRRRCPCVGVVRNQLILLLHYMPMLRMS